MIDRELLANSGDTVPHQNGLLIYLLGQPSPRLILPPLSSRKAVAVHPGNSTRVTSISVSGYPDIPKDESFEIIQVA